MLTTLISIARSIPGRLLPPIVWMGVIYALSDQPSLPYPKNLDGQMVSITGHFTVFAVLAVLSWWALGLTRMNDRQRAIIPVVLAILYGVADEWHQSFVPGRTPDIWDIVTDTAGATVAMLVVTWIQRRGVFRKWDGESDLPSPSR